VHTVTPTGPQTFSRDNALVLQPAESISVVPVVNGDPGLQVDSWAVEGSFASADPWRTI
jgi:hypothetical protein